MFSYGSHPRQIVRDFHIESSSENVFIFIHGGAWRDPNNSALDCQDLVNHLNNDNQSPSNFFSIDYRLAPEVQFPSFLLDVQFAIILIKDYLGRHHRDLAKLKYHFIGHSVGVTLILQLLDYNWIQLNWFNNNTGNQLAELHQLLESYTDHYSFTISQISTINHLWRIFHDELGFLETQIGNIYLLDGIYDTDTLIEQYPAYQSFVREANGSFYSTNYRFANSQYFQTATAVSNSSIYIVHSSRDELLDDKQHKQFLQKYQWKVRLIEADFGTHEDVYKHREVAELIRKSVL